MFELPVDPFDGKSKSEKNRWVFIGAKGSSVGAFVAGDNSGFRTWTKPHGCNFVKVTCIGGGGGGGGAFQSSGTLDGGGGGASGSITHGLWPAFIFPDRVYVMPGAGGAGAYRPNNTSSPTGTYGGRSLISIQPFINPEAANASWGGNSCVMLSALGGGPATNLTAGASQIGNDTHNPLGTSGIIQYWPGQDGAAGTGASAQWALNGGFLSGGGGGGGKTASTAQNGGGITIPYTANKFIPSSVAGGTANASIPTIYGNNGIWSWGPPFYGTGGTGGGASTTALGGEGGHGAYGCGGGGGGASAAVTTGIRGGDGGPGLVIFEVF